MQSDKSRHTTKYKKAALVRIAFLLAVVVAACSIFGVLDRLLCIKSQAGVNQARAMYYQPKNTIDVVFMGTSHTHCNINTAWLWEEQGVAAYDLSGAEQPLWMTYYYLREICKRQTPSLVVLDVYAPAYNQEDYHYKWIEENILGMRFSVNKVKMLLDSVERGRIKEFFPSFAVYHSRWREINDEDRRALFHMKEDAEAYKGFTPFTNTFPMEQPSDQGVTASQLSEELSGEENMDSVPRENGTGGQYTEQGLDALISAISLGSPDVPLPEGVSPGPSYGLSTKSEEYLRKIISYTKEKNIPLLLVNAPYPVTEAERSVYNQIRDVAAMEGIPFVDFNYCTDLMGLDYATDFNDQTHLNVQGSIRYTSFLWKLLSAGYNIPQHLEYVDCASVSEAGDNSFTAEENSSGLTEAEKPSGLMAENNPSGFTAENNPYESWNRHVLRIRQELESMGYQTAPVP